MAIFVDTGGWFAYFVRRDPDHPAAMEWMRQNRQPLVTTDFVFDELVTLLALRESRRVAVAAGDLLWRKQVADLEHVAQGDLVEAWDVFRQFQDKEWSFTDCTSKVVISRLKITEAFAFDHHFEQFGTVIRVP
jgi:predicted nucleic acid-binding protein